LTEDITSAIAAASAGKKISFPEKTTSLLSWSESLTNFSNSDAKLQLETDLWKQALKGARNASIRNLDVPLPRFSDVTTLDVSLDVASTTKLISKFTSTFQTTINDILVTSLAIASSTMLGHGLYFSMEGHGRESDLLGMDVSRTLGWFTSIFPVHIPASPSSNLRHALANPDNSSTRLEDSMQRELLALFKTAKQQLRAGTPNHGIGYGLLRYLNTSISPVFDANLLEDEICASEILVNYLGKSDGSSLGSASLGSLVDRNDIFNRLIDVNAFLRSEKFEFSWTFAPQNIIDSFSVNEFVRLTLRVLRELSDLPDTLAELGGRVPADFPLLAGVLTQHQVDVIATNEVEDLLPLLPMQQGLLFHALLDPTATAYTNQMIYDLPVDVDVTALHFAWKSLIARHSILRTGFAWEHGLSQAIQVVFKSAPLEWKEITIPGSLDAELEEIRLSDLKEGFDLHVPSLNRFSVVRSSAEPKLKLLWTIHHLYLDGWSLSLIIQELDSLCRARSLPPTPALSGFLDWWSQQDPQLAHNFWSHTLKGFHTPTPLPAAALQPASRVVDRISTELTAPQTASLLAFARKQHVTLNTLLEASWGMVLNAHSRENDVVFGATVSGRSTTEVAQIERMVGLFINTMPVRVSFKPSETISDFLHRLQDQHSAAMSLEYVPLVQAQSASEITKGLSLFETIFVFENYPVQAEDECEVFSAVPTQKLDLTNVIAFEQTNYALSVTAAIDPSTQRLILGFIYDTGKYPDSRIVHNLLDQFKNAIYNLTLEENNFVAQVVLEDIDQSNLSIGPLDGTSPDNLALKPIHEQFVTQATETCPDSVAIVLDDEQVSYRTLEFRSSFLAQVLQQAGVVPGDVISVCLPRSIELVVSILAVLRVGATYVPIDPSYPADRQQYLVEDSGSCLTLVSESIATEHLGTTLNVDLLQWYSPSPSAFNAVEISPLAYPYMIYTSGTTGKPKGVPMSHAGFATRLDWMRRLVDWDSDTVFLQTISSSFDPSAYELLGPITTGSRLVLARHGMQGDALYLADSIERFQVTGMTSVPSLLAAFLAATTIDSNTSSKQENMLAKSSLKHVICGGEALPSHTASTFQSMIPKARLFNAYGPTETCIIATVLECNVTLSDVSFNAPTETFCSIGSPAANVFVHLVDETMKTVPLGVTGELLVGGSGLSPGYLGRPSLTAERFVPAPHGQRLYRTGDLVRFRPSNGQLEFVGRIDMQVKVRGFRVELGEIEAQIEHHANVVQAAVIVSQSASSSAVQLIAFAMLESSISSGQSINFTLHEILAHLRRTLPPHMVPSSITRLKSLPLTTNGKMDRAKLAELEETNAFAKETDFATVSVSSVSSTFIGTYGSPTSTFTEHIAPRNDYESTIANVWKRVLKLDNLPSIHDSFFELGGDSIVSILVASQSSKLGAPLTVRQLIQHRTIAEISFALFGTSVMSSNASASSGNPKIVIRAPLLPAPQEDLGHSTDSFPVTPIQKWFLHDSSIEEKHHWNHSRLVAIPRSVSPSTIKSIAKVLIAHHDALRLQFFKSHNNGEWEQRYLPCSQALFDSMFVNVDVPGDQLSQSMTEIESGFSLASDDEALFKMALLRSTTDNSQFVLFAQHHLITDFLSSLVLLEDFNTLLEKSQESSSSSPNVASLVLALTSALPPKSNSFAQFAKIQMDHVSRVPKDEKAYWFNVPVSDGEDCIQTPADFPAPSSSGSYRTINTLETSDTSVFILPSKVTKHMLSVTHKYRCSVQDIIMTALYFAFRQWSPPMRGKQLIIDLESHGREQDMFEDYSLDLSRTMGWFTTVYPFAFGSALEEMQSLIHILEAIIDARQFVPHMGFTFGLLRYFGDEEMQRKLAAQQPQILLNYLGEVKPATSPSSSSSSPSSSSPSSPSSTTSSSMRSPAQPSHPSAPPPTQQKLPDMGSQRASHGLRQRFIEMNASIINGELSIAIEFCKQIHMETTIAKFGANMLAAISSLCDESVTATLSRASPAIPSALLLSASMSSPPPVLTSLWIHPVDGTTLGLESLVESLGLKSRAVIPSLEAHQLRQISSVQELASLYLQTLVTCDPTGPYIIGGYSFGASVAFEVAKRLGDKVKHLIIIDQPVLPSWTPGDGRRMTSHAVFRFAIKIINTSLRGMGLQTITDTEQQQLKLSEGSSSSSSPSSPSPASVILPLAPFDQLLAERQVMLDVRHSLIQQIDTYQQLGRIFNAYDWNKTPSLSSEDSSSSLHDDATTSDLPLVLRAPISIVRSNENRNEPHGMGWTRFGTVDRDVPIDSDHYSILKYPALDQLLASLQAILTP